MTPNDIEAKVVSHRHAWKGSWNRPLHVDENSHSALTIARMTDHNVRGNDRAAGSDDGESQLVSDHDGHYDMDGVSLVEHKHFEVVVASDATHV